MREDIFILILGYGRTGTSLCAGLLDSSPNVSIGYEINNNLIHSTMKDEFLSKINLSEINLSEFPKLSDEYNGNKIVFNSSTSLQLVKFAIENRYLFMNSIGEILKVVFTDRNSVSSIVSRMKRVSSKGIYLDYRFAVDEFIVSQSLIKRMKRYFSKNGIDYFIFDFDSVLEQPIEEVSQLFEFVGEEFDENYVTNYKGSRNYADARGVSEKNVVFGRTDKFKDLRTDIKRAFIERSFLENLD